MARRKWPIFLGTHPGRLLVWLEKRRLCCPPTQVGQWLLSQVSQYPEIPLKVLYERWTVSGQQLPSLRTLYRFLRSKGYDAASLRRGRLQTGPTKAFEAPFVNDLWMTDFSPGPKLNIDGKVLTTQLCLILDDHSRLIAHGAYYPKADSYAFHQTLKQAVQRRGIPYKLYTDQGGPFTNKHTQIICANLGIRLLHAKPYSAWSKGKIERCFYTVQQGFESTLDLPANRARSLEKRERKAGPLDPDCLSFACARFDRSKSPTAFCTGCRHPAPH